VLKENPIAKFGAASSDTSPASYRALTAAMNPNTTASA
jgi:hypothetical protein